MNLIIETSTSLCVLALYDGKEILESIAFEHNNNLSKTLLPAIDQLKRTSLLKGIALGIGPGSYTGTRVGAAVAKGLSFALNIPITPFYSPLAFLPKGVEGDFTLLLPTKAGPFFAVEGVVESGLIKNVSSCKYDTIPTSANLIYPIPQEPHLPPLCSFLAGERSFPAEEISLSYLATIN
ncbi:MAG: hypothetical protein RLZZ453_949 [Chlamydiota bacterium]|jgi:tRNA threonylcarbamoyl adenosine modification protein YeaZ